MKFLRWEGPRLWHVAAVIGGVVVLGALTVLFDYQPSGLRTADVPRTEGGRSMALGLWVILAAWVYVIQPVGGWLLDHPAVVFLLLAWWLSAVIDRLRTAVKELKGEVEELKHTVSLMKRSLDSKDFAPVTFETDETET